MIKTLKISALALVLSVASFQAYASDHSSGFDCNICDFKHGKTASEDEAKQCSDCKFSEIGDWSYGVWSAQCAKLTGAELKDSKVCRYAQKAGSKVVFGYLDAANLKDADKDKEPKRVRYAGKIIKNAIKVGDAEQ